MFVALVDQILSHYIQGFEHREDRLEIRASFVELCGLSKKDTSIETYKKIQATTGLNFDGLNHFYEGSDVVFYDEEIETCKFVKFHDYKKSIPRIDGPTPVFSFKQFDEVQVEEEDEVVELDLNEFVIEETIERGMTDSNIAAITQLLCSNKDTAHVNVTPFIDMLNTESALPMQTLNLSQLPTQSLVTGKTGLYPCVVNKVRIHDMDEFIQRWNNMYADKSMTYADKERLTYFELYPFDVYGNENLAPTMFKISPQSDIDVWNRDIEKFMRCIGKDLHYNGDDVVVDGFVTKYDNDGDIRLDDDIRTFDLNVYLENLRTLKVGSDVFVVDNTVCHSMHSDQGPTVSKQDIAVSKQDIAVSKQKVIEITDSTITTKLNSLTTSISLREYNGKLAFPHMEDVIDKYMVNRSKFYIVPSTSLQQTLSFVVPSDEEKLVFAIRDGYAVQNTHDILRLFNDEYGVRVTDSMTEKIKLHISSTSKNDTYEDLLRPSTMHAPLPHQPLAWKDIMKEVANTVKGDVYEIEDDSAPDGRTDFAEAYLTDWDLHLKLRTKGLVVVFCHDATFVWENGTHNPKLAFANGRVVPTGTKKKTKLVPANKDELIREIHMLLDDNEPFGDLDPQQFHLNTEVRKEKKYAGDEIKEEFVYDEIHSEVIDIDRVDYTFVSQVTLYVDVVFGKTHHEYQRIKDVTSIITKFFVEKHFKAKGVKGSNFEVPKDFEFSKEVYNTLMVIHDNNESRVMAEIRNVCSYFIAATILVLIKMKEFQVHGIQGEKKQFDVLRNAFELIHGNRNNIKQDLEYVNTTAQKIMLYEKMLRGITNKYIGNLNAVEESKYGIWPTYKPQHIEPLNNVELMRVTYTKVPTKFNMIVDVVEVSVDIEEQHDDGFSLVAKEHIKYDDSKPESLSHKLLNQVKTQSIPKPLVSEMTDDEILQKFVKANSHLLDNSLTSFKSVMDVGVTKRANNITEKVYKYHGQKIHQALATFIHTDLARICDVIIHHKELLHRLSLDNFETLAVYILVCVMDKFPSKRQELNERLDARIDTDNVDISALQTKFDVLRANYNQSTWGPLKAIPRDDRELYTLLMDARMLTTRELIEDIEDQKTEMIHVNNVDDEDDYAYVKE